MSSTQHQLIEQCAIRLRGIVEALDNIHDTSPHRWSTDLDDVHSLAESLLALIKDRAPTPCIDCKGTGFCNSISGEEIRCPCHAPIQFADPAQTPVEQFEQAPPSEDQLTAAGLSYPLAKEDAVKLWYAGFRSEVVTVLEAWEAIGHDIGMNPSKGELLDSLRNMAAICDAHGNDMPGQSAIAQRQVIADAITGALAFGAQASRPPPADHWLRPFYDIGRAEGQRTQELAMLVRMLASSLKRHAPESNLVARATNYLAAKGLAGTPLRDAPASVEQAGGDRRDALQSIMEWTAAENIPDDRKLCLIRNAARAALAQPSPKCATCGGTGMVDDGEITCSEGGIPYENGPVKCVKDCPDCKAQPSPAPAEQAEAERSALWAVHAQGPDELYAAFSREDAEKHAAELNALPMPEGIAVGAVVVPSPWPAVQHWQYLAEQEQDHKNEIAGRLRQHERIGEALRAEITQLRQHKNDYMDAGQETYRALQNEIREREAEIARLDGLVSGRTAERDAALAEVERLRESKGDPSGSFDRCMKMMYERDENAKRLDAALARVAELEKGTVYVEARQCDECQHVGINDSADGLAACHDCDWTGPEPDEDKCPDCQRENCMAAACPQCGARYVLVASEEIAAPVAQAQHSVPEVSGIGRDFAYPRSVVLYLRTEPTDDDLRAIHDGLRSLAAAPGKEVPQAWLDVQAERRRQITAEGWTPEHDDEHDNGEMARAAACYALAGSSAPSDGTAALLVSLAWPWDEQWWKPSTARRDMVKACALGLAEIERLDRVAASQGGPSDA